jgi:hypothetical protein
MLNHTPELEAAMIATHYATDSRGLRIMLCRAGDPRDVYSELKRLSGLLNPELRFVSENWKPLDDKFQQRATVNLTHHIYLLANLLHQHVLAGNWP